MAARMALSEETLNGSPFVCLTDGNRSALTFKNLYSILCSFLFFSGIALCETFCTSSSQTSRKREEDAIFNSSRCRLSIDRRHLCSQSDCAFTRKSVTEVCVVPISFHSGQSTSVLPYNLNSNLCKEFVLSMLNAINVVSLIIQRNLFFSVRSHLYPVLN